MSAFVPKSQTDFPYFDTFFQNRKIHRFYPLVAKGLPTVKPKIPKQEEPERFFLFLPLPQRDSHRRAGVKIRKINIPFNLSKQNYIK